MTVEKSLATMQHQMTADAGLSLKTAKKLPQKRENLDSSGRFLQNHWTRMERIMVYWSVKGKSQMKSGSTIWLIVGLTLLISGCPFKSGVEGKAWFRYASRLDKARKTALANDAANKKGTALEDLARIHKFKQKFLRAKQPTETEIISVLKSPNRRFQKVGLVAMRLKPIETEQLTEILFGFLQDNDLYVRGDALYALDRFTKFPESKKASLGKQLLEITKKNEKSKEILAVEFDLLAKFPSEEAALFLTKQLMKEGKENHLFRKVAFNALKEMGNSYYDNAAEYVNNHGSPEIKKDLLEQEKLFERYKQEKNKDL